MKLLCIIIAFALAAVSSVDPFHSPGDLLENWCPAYKKQCLTKQIKCCKRLHRSITENGYVVCKRKHKYRKVVKTNCCIGENDVCHETEIGCCRYFKTICDKLNMPQCKHVYARVKYIVNIIKQFFDTNPQKRPISYYNGRSGRSIKLDKDNSNSLKEGIEKFRQRLIKKMIEISSRNHHRTHNEKSNILTSIDMSNGVLPRKYLHLAKTRAGVWGVVGKHALEKKRAARKDHVKRGSTILSRHRRFISETNATFEEVRALVNKFPGPVFNCCGIMDITCDAYLYGCCPGNEPINTIPGFPICVKTRIRNVACCKKYQQCAPNIPRCCGNLVPIRDKYTLQCFDSVYTNPPDYTTPPLPTTPRPFCDDGTFDCIKKKFKVYPIQKNMKRKDLFPQDYWN